MAGLGDVVVVNIERGTQTVTQTGFGIPFIFGVHTRFAEDFKIYNSIDSVLEDFQTGDEEYVMANAIFSQNPRPESIIIGKRVANVKQLTNVDVTTIVDSTDYTVTINGTPFVYNSGVGATASSIVDGLIIAINAGSEPVTLTDNGDDFDVEADVAGDPFTISVDSNMTLTETTDNVNVATEISRIQSLNGGNDWYFLLLTTSTDQDIKQAAAYIETQLKMYMAYGSDSDIITSSTSDIASELKDLNYDRTAIIYSGDSDRLDAAWIGKVAPKEPGEITWRFKNLNGVSSDALSDTEISNATGKNSNIYIERGGVDQTEEGVVISGEFCDIIRSTDWIQARLEENVYSLLVNNDKIPYTNNGIQTIRATVESVLRSAIDQGILTDDPAPVVTVPDISAVSSADKSSRTLRDVDFTGTFQGAIHKVIIEGKISV